MAYRLYSKLPGQTRYYVTCPETLKQRRNMQTVKLFWDIKEAEKAVENARKSCITPAALFAVRDDEGFAI